MLSNHLPAVLQIHLSAIFSFLDLIFPTKILLNHGTSLRIHLPQDVLIHLPQDVLIYIQSLRTV